VGLRALEQELPTGDARERLAMLRELTARTLGEVGRLARGLHPSVLDDLGFAAAVERYASEYSEGHGIPVDVHIRGIDDDHRLPQAVETTLYRILQEALTNIAKHAAASNASVIVERDDGLVRAIIEDDGCGFEPESQPEVETGGGGLGIHSIRERAALIRGSVAIESTPGHGTTLFVSIPVTSEPV
jgi:signal transduction histidine kinase